MSKQRSTLSKGRNFNAKLVRRCCRLWQQSRTLLRHCCWCGPGLTLTLTYINGDRYIFAPRRISHGNKNAAGGLISSRNAPGDTFRPETLFRDTGDIRKYSLIGWPPAWQMGWCSWTRERRVDNNPASLVGWEKFNKEGRCQYHYQRLQPTQRRHQLTLTRQR